MTAGFCLRIVMTVYPNSLPIYLCSQLFILLSPAAFLAFNYVLYGRFVINCIERRHSLVRPERTARYFVISDIITLIVQVRIPFPDTLSATSFFFWTQGTGGSFMTSTDLNTVKVGAYIVIGGLALQTLSFGLYIFFVYHAYRSLKQHGVKLALEPWGKILQLLLFTSALFLVRRIPFLAMSLAHDDVYSVTMHIPYHRIRPRARKWLSIRSRR